MTDEIVRSMRRFYYANIDLLDGEVGRIVRHGLSLYTALLEASSTTLKATPPGKPTPPHRVARTKRLHRRAAVESVEAGPD